MMDTQITEEQSKLIESNVGLAQYLAQVTWRKQGCKTDLDELLSSAYQGLIIAARNFSPYEHGRSQESIDSGLAFSTYARRRIVGAMLDWQRSQDHVPRRQRKIYKDAQELLDLNEGITSSELASEVGISVDKLKDILRRVEESPVSLQYYHEAEESPYELGLSIPSSEDTESSSLTARISEALVDSWDKMPVRQRLILALRFYAESDLDSIYSVLDLPYKEIKRLYEEGLYEMHEAMMREAVG